MFFLFYYFGTRKRFHERISFRTPSFKFNDFLVENNVLSDGQVSVCVSEIHLINDYVIWWSADDVVYRGTIFSL
jgi:hypothetical protein